MITHKRKIRLMAMVSGLCAFLWPLIASAQSSAGSIPLLQKIGDLSSLPTGGGPFSIFNAYFEAIYPWVQGVAAGIAVFWGLWGMTGVIMSGGDQGKRGESIKQVQAAVLGLLLLLFVNVIMHTINPAFFKTN